MGGAVVLNTTNNLLSYSGRLVKVVPKAETLKITFKLHVKKGCGRFVKEV